MTAPKDILRLVERFDAQREAYQSGQYKETEIRVEFIDPFFKTLGWDVHNEQGYAEAYKDVIHEDALKIGGATDAPDSCFRIGGVRKFFVECKKPSVNIKDAPHPAYQLRRYGWSAKLPLSILTDFQEFAVYDCRIKPNKNDSAATARVLYLRCDEYVQRWDEIAAIFSREAVLKGSFDKFAEGTKGKRGTASVDDAFLEEIERWRDLLARNIALRNPALSQRELNFAVQRTIDRIIFLRICEDRGIEDYGRLLALIAGPRIYPRLCQFFEAADTRYNSGIFHFSPEKDRHEPPDELTLRLKIDDKPLHDILRGLYYPDSPYEFSVLSADILGQVYEQFLGKVIRLTEGHQAKVEEKPEVRKAGGVYYTPTYIVDYIVRQTVGKLVEGKTLKQVAKLRILDPACGSGSFLLGAYQYLLDWHRDWYVGRLKDEGGSLKSEIGNLKSKIYEGPGGDWRLMTEERKRILLNNIYGVDIDSQAVEVTKLSLLLKVLEGESQETITKQFELFHQRVLPDLASNIKCGNSLIGPDFYQQSELPLLTDDEKYRINVFDWQSEFPQVFGAKTGYPPPALRSPPAEGWPKAGVGGESIGGGFDAIIGNPPYGFHQIHSDNVKSYFKSHYASSGGSFEHYFLFYEASLKKLSKDGFHGFIVPVTWLTIPSAGSLRKFVLDNFSLESIAWLPELVFKNAQVNTLVSVIRRRKPSVTKVLISEANDPSLRLGTTIELAQSKFVAAGHIIRIFESTPETDLLEKIESRCAPLGSLARPCSGYNPYEVGKGLAPNGRPHTSETVATRPYHAKTKRGKDWKPETIGRDLGRYSLEWPRNRFVKYGPWLAAARDPNNFVGPRLLVQEITGGHERRIIGTFCEKELYHSRDVIPVKCESAWPSPLFLLGILNSWLMTWRHHRRSPKAKKALFPKVLVNDLSQIPVPKLLEADPADRTRHDQMVKLVDQMLELHKKLAAARTPQEKTALERQFSATDREIDQLVYELYGLTKDEIKIVEESTVSK